MYVFIFVAVLAKGYADKGWEPADKAVPSRISGSVAKTMHFHFVLPVFKGLIRLLKNA
jgi:hypothetical protein